MKIYYFIESVEPRNLTMTIVSWTDSTVSEKQRCNAFIPQPLPTTPEALDSYILSSNSIPRHHFELVERAKSAPSLSFITDLIDVVREVSIPDPEAAASIPIVDIGG